MRDGGMVMKRQVGIGWALALALASAGCAGSGGGGEFAYAGQYHNSYSRGGGTIVFGASSGNSVSVVVNDSSGYFSGQGTREGSTFSIVATGIPGTLNVQGAFSGTGSGRTIVGSVTGLHSFDYATIYAHSPGVAVFDPFAYRATMAGDVSGTVDVATNANGQITGTMALSGESAVPVTGSVSSVGTASFSATLNSEKFTFFGVFRVMSANSIVLEGTWTSLPKGGRGTWQGGILN